jgi:hypothetical protein
MALSQALGAIPDGVRVGMVIASEPLQQVALAPWSEQQKQAVMSALRATPFVGGQDNAPALAAALEKVESEPNATLLWVHGPQPVRFHDGTARLEQALARLSRLPAVVLYNAEPGPNELLSDAPWVWNARSLPQTGSRRADLSAFFAEVTGRTQTYDIQRTQRDPAADSAKGSDHIARLWANQQVLAALRANPAGNRAAAVALAARYRLVTPVSGAVVLETQQQYDANRLTPVSQATVPTVPEPHEWALILIACVALGWFAWRNRQAWAVAA